MFPRKGAVAFAFAAACAVSACHDDTPTYVDRPGQAAFSQLDGATTGNPHFYFLPPLTYTGPGTIATFNPDLYPTVEICNGTAQTATHHCQQLIASFTRTGGVNNNGNIITIPAGQELYKIDWQSGAYAVPVNTPLRIIVLLGDIEAGYIDVVKTTAGGFEMAGTQFDITPNSTLPIKFRLEDGVICGAAASCTETTIGPAGGTVTLSDGEYTYAGAQFAPNALTNPVNLIIEEVTGAECLPTDVQQFSKCFHYSTEPEIANFNVPVIIGFCMTDPVGLPYLSNGELRLWKWDEVSGHPMVELERVTVDFLDCPDLSASSYRATSPFVRSLARAGSALISPLAMLVGPRELHAIGGEGGKLINFSRVGWVRPLAVSISQGNNQTAFAGAPVAVPPTVRVTNRYGVGPQSVAGRTVNFLPSPNGTASPSSAVSGANGLAATAWKLGTTAGANSMVARVQTSRPVAPAPYEAQTTFNATAASPLNVNWLPPVGSKKAGVTPLTGLSPVMTISVVGGGTLATLNMVESSGTYATSWNIPNLQASQTYRLAVSSGGGQHGFILLQAVDGELRNVATGEKVLNLKNSRTLPIKIALYR